MGINNSPFFIFLGVCCILFTAYQLIPLYFSKSSGRRKKVEKEFNRYFNFLVRQEELKLSEGKVGIFGSSKKQSQTRFRNKEVEELLTKLEWGNDLSWNKECLDLAKQLKWSLNHKNFTLITQYIIQHFIKELDQSLSKKELILFSLYLTSFYQAVIQQKNIRNNTPDGAILSDGIYLHLLLRSRDINFESNFSFLAQNLSQKDFHDYIAEFILKKDFSYKTWVEMSEFSKSLKDPFLDKDQEEALKQLFPDKTEKGIKNSFKKLAKSYHPDRVNLNLIPEKYHKEVKEIISERFQKINQLKDDALNQLSE